MKPRSPMPRIMMLNSLVGIIPTVSLCIGLLAINSSLGLERANKIIPLSTM